MGEPITVVTKPSRTPGVVRYETNRSFTGMGHERYGSIDDVVANRPVDDLARRLFATGGVHAIHVNNSVVTIELTHEWQGDGGDHADELADVIRGLYIHYPEGQSGEAQSTNGAGGTEIPDAPASAETEAEAPADPASQPPSETEPQ